MVDADPPLVLPIESSPTDAPAGATESLFGPWWKVAAAGLTGFLYFLAFPGVDCWPLAFVAWIPWMLALPGSSPKQAALQGLAVGLVSHICGFSWLLGMLEIFSGFPTWICAIFMLLLCAYQGASFSLLGWLYARAQGRGWPAGFVFTAAFAASESIVPLLFPYTFAATMHLVYPMIQVAEIGGPILVALGVLAPNWALALVIRRVVLLKRKDGLFSISRAFHSVGWLRFAPSLLVPVLFSVYGLLRIVQIDKRVHDAEKTRVGIVQANISLTDKVKNTSDALEEHIKITRKLLRTDKIELAIWPETAIGGAVHVDDAAESYRRNVTRRLGVPAIIGAILWKPVDDARERALYNSALISGDNGTIKGRYDKQYLLLFGEYLPLGERFPILYEWSPNSGSFSKGTTFDPLPFENHEIATFICYEDLDADFVNKLMDHGKPDLLVNMTNDAWFGDTSEPWEHMALSQMRAVEQRRFLVRSTNSGVSGFVDPVGRLVKNSETFVAVGLAHEVAWLDITTPFRHWGNTPWKCLSWLVVALAFVRRPEWLGRARPFDA